MRQLVDVESRPGIGDTVHQHPARAEARDADLARWIELAAPFDGVHQQLAKCGGHRFPHLRREFRIEVGHDGLNALGGFMGARQHQLHPVGPGRDHFDRGRLGRSQYVAHRFEQRRRVDRLVQIAHRLVPHRLEHRLWRVVRRHHDHPRTAFPRANPRQHIEAAHARHPHIEQQQIDGSPQRSERFVAVAGESHRESGALEHLAQHMARDAVVVDDENSFHDGLTPQLT